MAAILQPSRNVWSERGVEAAAALIDGDDYYRAFYESAALARNYILLAGWQFDSDACLLRGDEAKGAPLPVTLLKYLNALCERAPELRIYVLAWDFHAVFALEREWMQDLVFNWGTSERLVFRFDDSHVENGSHHQKFVVVDGVISYLGGLDLCDHRWDTRKHKDPDPLRTSRGAPHKPFHDIQAYFAGKELAGDLVRLFTARWEASGGKALSLPPPRDDFPGFSPAGAVWLAAQRVALSRTDPHGNPTAETDCREVRALYLDAIAAAQRLIYIETQYFSSKDVGAALVERMHAAGPALEIVVILNMAAETLKEEVAVGLAQARIIGELKKAASETEHRLGIYYTLPFAEDGTPERATYIHSKAMIVDDRFLTIGSANLTNRSMGVDTELNASFETAQPGDALGEAIGKLRRSLIEEHLGCALETGSEESGLVAFLDAQAARTDRRLRPHPSPTEKERAILEVIDPQKLPFDPAAIEEHDDDRSIFVSGLGPLWARLVGSTDPLRTSDHGSPGE